jgi:hypothetical protein
VGKTPLIYTDEEQLVIPISLQNEIIKWYHHFLLHPGETRMTKTIKKNYGGKA